MNKKYFGLGRFVAPKDMMPKSTVKIKPSKSVKQEESAPQPQAKSAAGMLPFQVSQEAQESAKKFITEGFRTFAEHSQQMVKEAADFDKKREEVRREIECGARRTTGRII